MANPNVIQIRRIFDNVNKAREWENKVLRRMKVIKRNDFLNKSTNKSICPKCASKASKGKSYEEIYGIDRARELKLLRSISNRNRSRRPWNQESKNKIIGVRKNGGNNNAKSVKIRFYDDNEYIFATYKEAQEFISEYLQCSLISVISAFRRKIKGMEDITLKKKSMKLHKSFQILK